MPNFAEWQPDVVPWNNDVAAEASGVLPTEGGYAPFPQPDSSSSAAAGTVIQGAFAARSASDTIKIFAFSATKTYEGGAAGAAWTDRTNASSHTLATDEYWSAVQYGTNVIFANSGDNVMVIAAAGGGAATDLGGTPPNSRFPAVIGDYVFLGNTANSVREIKNSGLNDSTTWTLGTKSSSAQTFQDGGAVQGLVGFEQGGFIFQSDTVRRLDIVTDARIFVPHKIDYAYGTTSPYSIVTRGGEVFYYSPAGFVRLGFDGSFEPIGKGKVDEWFRDNSNVTRPKAIIGALDPVSQRVFWLFATASNASSTTLDGLIVYDIDRKKWTHATCALTYIFRALTPGATLTALAALYSTLAAMAAAPTTFGADVWRGGAPGIAAFDASNKLGFFTGTPMAASVQTSKFEPVPGMRGYVRGARLIGDAVNATAKIGGAERPQTAVVFNAAAAVNGQGRVPMRISTRWAQIQVDIAAGESWTGLAGIEFDQDDVTPDGKR